MSKKFTDIIGSRSITVNVFKDDNETTIAIRLLQAVLDEANDRLSSEEDTK